METKKYSGDGTQNDQQTPTTRTSRFMVLLRRFQKVIEIVTVFMFIAIIVVFALQVFSRYVLRDPVIWSLELAGILYIWTALLSVCFLAPFSIHIRFLLIKKAPLPMQRIGAIAIFLLLGVSFVLLIPDTQDLMKFLVLDSTTTLKIQMDKVFFIYLLFLYVIAGRAFYQVYRLLSRHWKKHLL